MYTVGGTSSWSTPPSIWFSPAVHSSFLGTFGWAVRWLCQHEVGVGFPVFPSSVVTRPNSLVYRLLSTVQGEFVVGMVWVVL
jgi:hypothetical protein